MSEGEREMLDRLHEQGILSDEAYAQAVRALSSRSAESSPRETSPPQPARVPPDSSESPQLGEPGAAARPSKGAASEQLASPGDRLIAAILDTIFIWAAAAVLRLPAVAVESSASYFGAFITLLSVAAMIVVFLVYPVLAEGRLGQTYGKHLLDLQVVDVTGAEPIGTGAAFARAVARAVGIMALGLGVLRILWDDDRQGVHDTAVRSKVVKVESGPHDNPWAHLRRIVGPLQIT